MKSLRRFTLAIPFLLLALPVLAQREPQGQRRSEGNQIQRPQRPREGQIRESRPMPHGGARSESRMEPRPEMRRGSFRPQERPPERMERPPRPDRDWPAPQQRRDRESRPEPRSPRGIGRPDRSAYVVQPRAREEARAWQGQRGWQQQGSWQPHNSWREHRVDNWQAAHRTWQQRGGYGGYYIPQDRFYAYYGPQNYFSFRPTIYMGYPRFWCSGYSFLIVDPWPGYWEDDWYDGDCYIDFIDGGYYLYNRRYPGVALAITVML